MVIEMIVQGPPNGDFWPGRAGCAETIERRGIFSWDAAADWSTLPWAVHSLLSLRRKMITEVTRRSLCFVITIPSILNDIYIFHQKLIYMLHQNVNMKRPGAIKQSGKCIHIGDQDWLFTDISQYWKVTPR